MRDEPIREAVGPDVGQSEQDTAPVVANVSDTRGSFSERRWEALGAPHDLDHDSHVNHIHLTDVQLTQLPVILRL